VTNLSKWFVAVPFTLLVALVIPALVAGNLLWFCHHWTDTLYLVLSAGMWLVATGFVDVKRPRGSPDLANRLLPLGLILSVPVAVWDRTHWIAATLPLAVSVIGILIGSIAVVLGVASRATLGRSYSPRAGPSGQADLVQDGPYRWIRHPLYLAALLWIVGWPLIIASLPGILVPIPIMAPAIRKRMIAEEEELLGVYGDEYAEYQERTWRLLPCVY
jgi:protein-S-isoprenylcysteine O-methyltransferase Ste14